MLEATGSSKTVYVHQTTLRYTQEDINLRELQWKTRLHERTLPITCISNQGDLVTVKNLGSNNYNTTFVPMRGRAARGQQRTKNYFLFLQFKATPPRLLVIHWNLSRIICTLNQICHFWGQWRSKIHTECMTRMGEKKYAYKILVWKPKRDDTGSETQVWMGE